MDNSNLLPVVSEDTLSKLGMDSIKDPALMIKTTELLAKENPHLGGFLRAMTELSDNDFVLCTGLAIYNLLRNQAEADQLKKDFLD